MKRLLLFTMCWSIFFLVPLSAANAAGTCGNGVLEGGEECDPGGPKFNDSPSGQACTTSAQCSDGGTCVSGHCRCTSNAECDTNVCATGPDGFGHCTCTTGASCFYAGSGGCCKFNCQAVGSGNACDDGNACSLGEQCNNVGQCTCSGGCDPTAGVGSICRPAIGPCDAAEICLAGVGCPADVKATAGTVCRPSSGECDPAETCTGSSTTCPAQQSPTGTPCTDDGNVCTNDVCDSNSACTHPNNTAPCSDGLFCNGNDTCNGGSCSVHAGSPCPSLGECNNATCDESADNCAVTAGTGCSSDNNPCTDDMCNGSGTCAHVNNSAPCTDNLYCNGSDTCGGGSCSIHAGNPCAGGADCNNACNEAADTCFNAAGTACTNDGNVCTDDKCDGAGTCAHPANTAPCNDGLYCNGADTCSGGACGHSGDPCAGGSQCNNICNETADNCFSPNGTTCASDGNVCTDDKCNGSGACGHVNNTAPCDDNLFCTVGEACSGGACGGGTARDCSNPNSDVCTTDSCDESHDTCVNSPNPAKNGQACNDHNACTNSTTCNAGVCANGTAVNCDDSSNCTADSCDPNSGCLHLTTVESAACEVCDDGIDNDGDDGTDHEDSGCATLYREQRFAVSSSSTAGKRSKRLFLGGDVLVDSAPGADIESSAPYPLGRSLAGVCGNDMKILAGVSAGMVQTQLVNIDQKGIEFGLGDNGETVLNIRDEYGSNGGTEVLKGVAPLVGPGTCSDDGVTVCKQSTDLCSSPANDCCIAPGALCAGQKTLSDPTNAYVDRTGSAPNFLRCQAALTAQDLDGAAIATLPGNVPGYTTADNAEIKAGAGNPLVQITLGGGLQVMEINRLKLSGNTELQLLGQEDTDLVIRVKKQLKTGGGGKITLGSNGLGNGSLTANHVLWNVEGAKGGKVNLKRATVFKGTILAPQRGCLIGGAVDLEGAVYCLSQSNGATRILHVPFTSCLTAAPQDDCVLP